MNSRNRKRDNEFVRKVMARTSGSPCQRACDLLPDLTQGRLNELDRQLVQSHLEHCEGCRSVAVVLGWVQPLLPDLAEVDPGPDFTRGVIARTTGALHPMAKAARRGEAVGPLGLMDRLGRWWVKQIFRPRFALEVAYVATTIMVLLTAVPGAPLKQEAHQARTMLEAGPRSLPLIGELMTMGEEQMDLATGEIRSNTATGWEKMRTGLETRSTRATEFRRGMMAHLELAWNQGRQGELSQAGYQLLEAAGDFRRTWNQWWGNQQENKGNNPNS